VPAFKIFKEKTMFDRLKRSFQLVGASAQVLRQDNHLLLFPIISAVALLLVVAAFALPLFGLARSTASAGAAPIRRPSCSTSSSTSSSSTSTRRWSAPS
jgi:hypothetical protein